MAGLMGVTVCSVSLTHDLAEQAGKQVALAREPVLHVLPEKEVRGPGGWKFALSPQNGAIVDVLDVEVYDDCFVVLKGPDNRLGLYHFVRSDRPAATIPKISPSGRAILPSFA
jgi:hypothetical protein